jgi:hypothetical protein
VSCWSFWKEKTFSLVENYPVLKFRKKRKAEEGNPSRHRKDALL